MAFIRITLFLLLLQIATQGLFSQGRYAIDSVEKLLGETHKIEDRIDLYLYLAQEYQRFDLDSARGMAYRAHMLADQSDRKDQLGRIYATLGKVAVLQDSMNLGEEFYLRALKYIEKDAEAKLLINVYLSLGNRNIEIDNYPEAMEYYQAAIRISLETGDSSYLPHLTNNLGIIYLRLKKYPEALDIHSRALMLFEEARDSSNIAGILSNMGSTYNEMRDLEIAEDYYRKALELFTKIGNHEGMAHALLKLGILNQSQGHCDTALLYLHRSLDIQKSLDVTLAGSKLIFEAETYIYIGICDLNQGRTQEAVKELQHGYQIALQSRQTSLIKLSSESLSHSYEELGNPEKALAYYKVYNTYTDSLFNEDVIRRTTRLEMQYQFDSRLKEKEVDELKQKRNTLIMISILAGLFMVILIFILLLKLEKNKKRKIELERKTLRDELDFRNKELTTFVINNLRRSELIISITEKLRTIALAETSQNKKAINEILADLKSDPSSQEWKEFEIRFQNVYTGFYKGLSAQWPDLTPNELRLCAFLRLNMSTKDIAAITYQSYNSIDVARFRLRKKLGLSKEDNLVTFLQQFE